MRIAFAGASGTGKSRLARHVSEKFGVEVCPVGSRSVAMEMGYTNPYDVDAAGKRLEFQSRLFLQKRVWESEHERFVTDRTHLDNLAYSVLHGCAPSYSAEEWGVRFDACERYELIIYLPHYAFQHLGGDPHRVKAIGYHLAFDALLEGLLRRCSNSRVLNCRTELREIRVEQWVAQFLHIQ